MSKKMRRAVVLAVSMLTLSQSLTFAAPVELTLEQSIDLALNNNPSIRIAQTDKERSTWGISEAKAGKLPTVSLGSGYNTNSGNTSGQDDVSNSLRMSWQVYNGGRTDASIDQAELNAKVADLGVEDAKQQIKLDTTTAYYDVLQATNLQDVAQETVDNWNAHMQIVQANYDAGTVAKVDVLRTQVELANAEQNLIKAKNQRALTVTELLNTINMDPNTEVELDSKLDYQPDNRALDDSITLAKQNRPSLKQVEANIDSASKGVEIAKSGNSPTVSLSASTGWDNTLLPRDNDWSVGVSASWNVFDAGVTHSKVNQAQADLSKAKLQAEQSTDAVEQEVRQSYLNMREAEQRLQSTDVATGNAKEDLYIAKEKYSAGTGTNLDVIDAQLALTQAETNHVQALYDYNINRAKLDKATGVAVEQPATGGGAQ